MSQWDILDSSEGSEEQDIAKYLVFRLNQELYATPLLGVREVVEPQAPKPIPNTAKYFLGLINIRGQIIGLVDLRIKLGYQHRDQEHQALLVFDSDSGPVAAMVDSVEAVLSFEPTSIHKNPNVRSQVPTEFLVGIAKHNEELVTIIDLNKCLASDDYVAITGSKMVG